MPERGYQYTVPGKDRAFIPPKWIFPAVFLLGAMALLMEHHVTPVISGRRHLHLNDFKHMYTAAAMIRSGENFYDPGALRAEAASRSIASLNPYVYPPLLAVLCIPLSFLSFPMAGWCWYAFNLALILVLLFLLAHFLSSLPRLWALVAAAFLLASSEPVFRTLTAGQLNLLLLVLITLSLVRLEKGGEKSAGVLIGLAAALKVFPALLILALFWRKHYRAGAWALGATVVFTLLGALGAGMHVSLDYLALLRKMSYGSSTWSQLGQHYHIDPANQSPAALITRLLTVMPEANLRGLAHLPDLARVLSTLTGLALLVGAFWGSFRRTGKQGDRLSWGLFLMTALLVPSLMWDHYLAMALLPCALLLNDLPRERPWLLIALALAVFLIQVPFNFWDPLFRSGWKVALAQVKLPGALILYGLLIIRLKKVDTNCE
jgi:hypothetical protein